MDRVGRGLCRIHALGIGLGRCQGLTGRRKSVYVIFKIAALTDPSEFDKPHSKEPTVRQRSTVIHLSQALKGNMLS